MIKAAIFTFYKSTNIGACTKRNQGKEMKMLADKTWG